MKRSSTIWSGLVAFALMCPAIFAQQQQTWTGTPSDTFRTRIVNTGRSEAIPITLQDASPTMPSLKVTLEPHQWDYKVLRVPGNASDDEASRLLNAEGNQGWEMVGILSSTTSGTSIVFKRQRPS